MDERTLTERVEGIEKFLQGELGMGLALNSGCDFGVVGKTDYREAQDMRNKTMSARLDQRDSSFEEIINRIQDATDRVCRRAGILEDIGNRVFGSLPVGVGAGGEKAQAPQGTFEHTLLALDWLDESLARLDRAGTRLERV